MQIRKQQKPTTKCNWRHKPRGFVYILFSRAHVVFPISTRGEFQGSKGVPCWIGVITDKSDTESLTCSLSRLHMSLNVHPTYTTALVYWSKFVLRSVGLEYNLSIYWPFLLNKLFMWVFFRGPITEARWSCI